MRRALLAMGTVAVLIAGAFVVFVTPRVAAATQMWTSDTDFAPGTFFSTETAGIGVDASIQLQQDPMQDWINEDPPSAPSPRQDPAMTFDATNGVVLMFGGLRQDLSYSNETWEYDVGANVWTNVTPALNPPARAEAGLSYDPFDQVAVLYGGIDGAGSRNDLWEFNVVAGTWSQITTPPPSPRPFESSPVYYDSTIDRHILAGKDPSGPGSFQTWAYDSTANSWAPLTTVGDPGMRSGHSLTFDRVSLRGVLFGGHEGLTMYGDVWEFNATDNTWTKRADHVPNITPNKRTDHAMAFGPSGAMNLLFGGIDEFSTYPPETWVWISPGPGQWFSLPGATAPGGRKDHAFAWDSVRDVVVMFGGMKSDSTITNETWAWGRGFYNSGTYESPTFDASCLADWTDLWFNETEPLTTLVRLQVANSTSATGPFVFLGPDGLPGTYYGTPGTPIYAGHDGKQYFRWKATLTTGDVKVTPLLHDVSVNYVCPSQAPRITVTNPADGATDVPLDAGIVITFSEPMQTGTVTYTFSDPGITFTESWNSPTDTVLTLSHTTLFAECTSYTVEVLAGRDQNENLDLVPGPVPNPWSFTTVCISPWIDTTNPADGAIDVPLDADIVITFSEPMNTGTVTYTFSDPGITFAESWNTPTDTILTLSHTTLFAECTLYTVDVTGGDDKAAQPLVPGPVPNPWSFTTVCPNPFIVSTNPADGAIDVPLDADIVITFSEPMNTGTVTYTFSDPGITFTESWNSPTDTVLTLTHTTLFAECTLYTVDVTAGEDKAAQPLVPGPVPNPWSFTTVCISPWIDTTNPADGATNVPLDANIVITFSEPMNTGTVTYTFSDPGITFTESWNSPTDTVLTLSHATWYASCTAYTVNVTAGRDLANLPLVPGPVPNPWTFNSDCPPTAPRNLRATISGGDVVLTWDSVLGATAYDVYESQNRFATFPSTWNLLGSPAVPTWTAIGHGSDTAAHYYVVRASDGTRQGPNSTMGVKAHLTFATAAAQTNIAWFSLMYRSSYGRASDIAAAVGYPTVDLIGKWDAARQRAFVYYYARGGWRGTDFVVNPGDGLFFNVLQAFTWDVAGTDLNVTLSFTLNGAPLGNVNWISVPYTGVYTLASQIANELGPGKVVELGLWDPATQSAVRWYWTGSAWTGTDFTIAPGAGVYLIIASSFTWNPMLVTPVVP